MDGRDAAPLAAVPERLDRPLRLGPFASGRDLLRFVTGAAVGAIVGLAASPVAGLLLGAGAAVLVLWRPGVESLESRVRAVGGFAWRRLSGGPVTRSGAPHGGRPAASFLRLADGRPIALLRAGGVPLAYLPPGDLAAQFERYRAVLRTVETELLLFVGSSPIHAGAVLPAAAGAGPEDRAAYEGYRQLVDVLARRRSVRTVLVGLPGAGTDAGSLRRLDTATGALQGRLGELGMPVERLRGSSLRDAGRAAGLAVLGGSA